MAFHFEASLQNSVVDVKGIGRFSKEGMNKLEFMRDQRSCSLFFFFVKYFLISLFVILLLESYNK